MTQTLLLTYDAISNRARYLLVLNVFSRIRELSKVIVNVFPSLTFYGI